MIQHNMSGAETNGDGEGGGLCVKDGEEWVICSVEIPVNTYE